MKKNELIRKGLRQLPTSPIFLVSMELDGKRNIITVGMFCIFSGTPTLVGIGLKPSRYSCGLIRESREYVVNVVTEKLMKAVKICGTNSGRDSDRFNLAKLTPRKGTEVKAPHIAESPAKIECRVVDELEIGDHIWFIGEVKAVIVDENYDWKDGLLFKWVAQDGFYYRVGDQIGKY